MNGCFCVVLWRYYGTCMDPGTHAIDNTPHIYATLVLLPERGWWFIAWGGCYLRGYSSPFFSLVFVAGLDRDQSQT
jgi:hypothetical protein